MKRKIIKIHQDECNGCGACVKACHEGAIEMIEGKARLVNDRYCDGLGDCLPACPAGAIEIIEREALPYDEEAVQNRMRDSQEDKIPCACPGTMTRSIENKQEKGQELFHTENAPKSELVQWPVQLRLINTDAEYFDGCNLLVAADCTAYAYGNFHKEFIKDHVTVIGCPKLDDLSYYREKLSAIMKKHELKTITVVRMEVPCCSGIISAVKEAMLESRTIIPYREVVISVEGDIK